MPMKPDRFYFHDALPPRFDSGIEGVTQCPGRSVAQRRHLDAVEYFSGESETQHFACGGFINATRTQIKDLLRVQLPDRRTVTAFDIIGVDFKLGFGVDLGITGEHQIVIAQLRVAVLRLLIDQYAAIEHSTTFAVQHTLELLAADTARNTVLHIQMKVSQLLITHGVQTIQFTCRAFLFEAGVVISSGPGTAKCQRCTLITALRLLRKIQTAQVIRAAAFILYTIVVQRGTLTDSKFR